MKRLLVLLVVTMLVAPVILNVDQAQVGKAEDASSTIVGTWRRTGGDAGGAISGMYSFSADGTALSIDRDGVTWLGAWETVGSGDVAFTLEAVNVDGTGMGQSLRFRVPEGVDEIPFGDGVLERIVPET